MSLKLATSEIPDLIIRQNMQRLQDHLNDNNHLNGFVHFELSFDQAVSNYKWRHNLGYVPQDVVTTKTTGPGTVTFNHDKFDDTYLDITTSGACTIRGFVGTTGASK